MTSSYESLTHSKWDCKYHIVFIPKCRKKQLYGKIRKFLGPVFRELSQTKRMFYHRRQDDGGSRAYVNTDSTKICSFFSNRYIKGKSAIAVTRQFYGKKRNFTGEQLWARGYAVSTVGFELAKIKEFIKNQESLYNKQDEEGFF